MERYNQRSISEDSGFLFSVLCESFMNLPVLISINESGNGYNIRDGSGIVIWGDDLPAGGGVEVVKTLSWLFVQEDRPLLMGKNEIDGKASLKSTINIILCNKYVKYARLIRGGSVSISMQYGSGAGNKIYGIEIKKV